MRAARTWSPRAAASAIVVGVALTSLGARAEPAPGGSTAVAETLFQQARDLFKQQRYAEACPRFAESQRLEPKLGTLLNLAVCHERVGKIATAWAEYTSVATIARREGVKDREEFARQQVAILAKKLARVTLQSGASPSDPTVTLDDQPLDRAALNTPLPIDPGKHRVGATAPGKIAWSTAIEVPAESADLAVPIPALEAAPAPKEPVAPPPAPSTPTPIAAEPLRPIAPPAHLVTLEPARTDWTVAYAGFGVGVAGALVGAVTGGFTLAQAGAIRDRCGDNKCASAETGPIRSTNTLANVSNVAFVVGGLGAGVGLVSLLVARTGAPAAPVASLTPIVGPGSLGLRGSF